MSKGDEFLEYKEEIPVLAPVQVVGGGIRIEPNENLDTDEVVVTFEAVAMVPTAEGPQLGMIPILMEVSVFDMLLSEMYDINDEPSNTSEEDNE